MTKEEVANLKTIQEWEDRLDGWKIGSKEAHWLDGTNGIRIGSGINYDTDTPLDRKSGRYYEMILDTMSLIPEGSDLSNLINKPLAAKNVEAANTTSNVSESQPVAAAEPYKDARGRVRTRSAKNRLPENKPPVQEEKTSSLWSRLYNRLRGNV